MQSEPIVVDYGHLSAIFIFHSLQNPYNWVVAGHFNPEILFLNKNPITDIIKKLKSRREKCVNHRNS